MYVISHFMYILCTLMYIYNMLYYFLINQRIILLFQLNFYIHKQLHHKYYLQCNECLMQH